MNIKKICYSKLWVLRKIRNQGAKKKKTRKKIVLKNLNNFWDGKKKLLDAFESKIFSTKCKGSGFLNLDRSKLKILTPKKMFQRLPIALAQVKAGNNLESLLNAIRQIVYSLYQPK